MPSNFGGAGGLQIDREGLVSVAMYIVRSGGEEALHTSMDSYSLYDVVAGQCN